MGLKLDFPIKEIGGIGGCSSPADGYCNKIKKMCEPVAKEFVRYGN
jgi:hypothetical protein